MNGRVYFAADDGTAGRELWTSDGTTGGTAMVADLVAGPNGSAPSAIFADASRLFFAATGLNLGSELWLSNGVVGDAPQLLGDINPGAGGSAPTGFMSFNGAVYFNAYAPATGRELFRSDGTPQGTALAVDMISGTSSTAFGETRVAGGRMYLVGPSSSGLFATDGTPAGTTRGLLRAVADGDPQSARDQHRRATCLHRRPARYHWLASGPDAARRGDLGYRWVARWHARAPRHRRRLPHLQADAT
jgi:ELWxxDGT repeat protein